MIYDALTNYLNEISQYNVLSEEKINILFDRIDEEEVFNKIFESNLRLVVFIAKKYFKYGISLTPMDIIQEGNLGLIKAIKKYKKDSKVKFSYYASIWINSYIENAIFDKSRIIRVSQKQEELLIKYKKKRELLINQLNRDVEVGEIAQALDIDLEQAQKLSVLSENEISLNLIVGENDDTELIEFIADDKELVDDLVNKKIDIRNALYNSGLTEREVEVLLLRYIDDRKTHSEIAKLYNLTKQRIEQIEKKALLKIRKSKYIFGLSLYRTNPNSALKKIGYSEKK